MREDFDFREPSQCKSCKRWSVNARQLSWWPCDHKPPLELYWMTECKKIQDEKLSPETVLIKQLSLHAIKRRIIINNSCYKLFGNVYLACGHDIIPRLRWSVDQQFIFQRSSYFDAIYFTTFWMYPICHYSYENTCDIFSNFKYYKIQVFVFHSVDKNIQSSSL